MDLPTIAIYEQRAKEWQQARTSDGAIYARAKKLGEQRIAPYPVLDLGCGPGPHLAALGAPVVAQDGAPAMVSLALAAVPSALGVCGDLLHLPLRRSSLGAAWASASYLHIKRVELPWALMDLHQALVPDAPIALSLRRGNKEGQLAGLRDDQFPGRFFAEIEVKELHSVLVGAGFSVSLCEVDSLDDGWIEVQAKRAPTLPDFVGPNMDILICGLNPSVYSAEVGVGFGRPGNRFWPAAIKAGMVSQDRDPRRALQNHGVGMTDLVKRATAKASDLKIYEYQEGMERVARLAQWLKPKMICFVGLSGYRAAIDKSAQAGIQSQLVGGTRVYLMPSTSGLNAHSSLDQLSEHFETALAFSKTL